MAGTGGVRDTRSDDLEGPGQGPGQGPGMGRGRGRGAP